MADTSSRKKGRKPIFRERSIWLTRIARILWTHVGLHREPSFQLRRRNQGDQGVEGAVKHLGVFLFC